jgi:hypothetical protein
MDNKSKSTDYLFSTSDTDNILFILYRELIFIYDGQKWGQLYINDINMPDTDFKNLKKPGIVEITPKISGKDFIKSFVVTGGFNPDTKTCVKTVYILNFKKNKQYDTLYKTEIDTYDCLLDFKYGDMKTNRYLHASINIDNRFLLLIGGKNEKNWLDSCEYLDFNTGKWEDFSPLKSARANFDSCYMVDQKCNKKSIFLYGGFNGLNTYADNLIEFCNLEINSSGKLKLDEWKNLKIVSGSDLNLPKISARFVRYDENILIIGGSDGKHMLKNVYELDPSNGEINKLGELKTPRNNFHVLLRDDYIHLVGGSANKYVYNEDEIENYVEMFTFDLSNRIESTNVASFKEIFLFPIRNFGINEYEFIQEPGFPYSSSLITKKFD